MELANRFQVPENALAYDLSTICDRVQRIFIDTSKEVLGYKRRGKKNGFQNLPGRLSITENWQMLMGE
jgi:hypothetical protein